MKKIFIVFLSILLVGCGINFAPTEEIPNYPTVVINRYAQETTPAPDGFGDPFYPTLGNFGYDVDHYKIELTVDPEKNHLQGITTIIAVALENFDQFYLDLSGLNVDSIVVNNIAAEFSQSGMKIHITPEQALFSGERFLVEIAYSGVPEPVMDNISHMASGWQTMPGGIFVASEPTGAMTWFPNNNYWGDKATFTFRITVPEGYEVVANGREAAVESAAGFSTYVWEETAPMSTYLATLVIGKYESEKQITQDGLEIINYFPVDTSELIRDSYVKTPEMIDFMNEMVGLYPFDVYGVVLVNEELGFALETQTRSLFGKQEMDEEIIMHELAHQWFGDHVTIKTWQDLWLKEGFATYFSYLWLEHTQGTPAFEQRIQDVYDSLVMAQYGLFFQPIGQVYSKMSNDLYGMTSYQKGAMTLHALRKEVGDETFFEIIRNFYAKYAGDSASTQDFITTAKEISGKELDLFFDLWLNEAWMPPKP